MSDSKSKRLADTRRSLPKPALDALLSETAGDPLRRAMWLDAVNRQWRALLPVNLRGHLRIGNMASGRLSVLASAPVWAGRARLVSDELLQAARSIGLNVEHLQVRVAIAAAAPVQAHESPPTPATRKAIKDVMALLDKT